MQQSCNEKIFATKSHGIKRRGAATNRSCRSGEQTEKNFLKKKVFIG